MMHSLLSQHWHAVRNLLPRLKEGVQALPRQLRGRSWVMLHDPLTQRFVRITALLQVGREEEILPCGLGARDTLRLEAAMPLYGHEMDDTVSPLETGLDFGVKLQKNDFIGKSALLAKGEPKITRVGLMVTGRGIIREHCSVFVGEEKIGDTTSGTFLPFLDGAYAMALVDKKHSELGTAVSVEVRGRRIEAEIVALPFYKKS